MRTTRGYVSPVDGTGGGRGVLSRRLPLLNAVGSLAIFAVLLALVSAGTVDGVDRHVTRWARTHRVAAVVTAAHVTTDVLSPLVVALALLIGAAWVARRERSWRPLLAAVTIVGATAVVVVGLKHAVDRPLPSAEPGARHGLAFPS